MGTRPSKFGIEQNLTNGMIELSSNRWEVGSAVFLFELECPKHTNK